MNYTLLDVPTAPDWISAMAAFAGVIFGGVSLWKLLARDKDKQHQLDALKAIVETQISVNKNLEAQIVQLIKQTIEFQEQTVVMSEALQIDRERLVAEKEHRLLLNRPEFIRYMANPGEESPTLFQLFLRNTGNTAYNLSAKVTSGETRGLQPIDSRQIIKKDAVLKLHFGRFPNLRSDKASDQTIDLIFSDLNRHYYRQVITWESNKLSISAPEEYSSKDTN